MFNDAGSRKRVFRTGGAAALIPSQLGELARDRERICAIDQEMLSNVELSLRFGERSVAAPPRYLPYPVIMQQFVREIAD